MENNQPDIQPIRLVIAGGGTGGHVQPAVAVIDVLKRRGLLADALWIGSSSDVERTVAERAGIPFHAIPTGKLRRYLSLHTVVDVGRIPAGIFSARRLLRQFKPDVVLSTGGFVSVPTVIAATHLAPVLTHEQTAILGLANRINARFADVVAVSYDETIHLAGRHRRVVVTGNPVRESLRDGVAGRCFAHFNFDPALPLLYVTGGARGASPLNKRVATLLPDLLESCQVLHQTGPAGANQDAAKLRAKRDQWPEHLRRRYQVVEFVGEELSDVYAAASLILSRAGGGTVAELANIGKPGVLIPLPGTGGDEQTRNAAVLAAAGAAIVLPQRQAESVRLSEILLDLISDQNRLREMGNNAKLVSRPDAAARLADELLMLAKP